LHLFLANKWLQRSAAKFILRQYVVQLCYPTYSPYEVFVIEVINFPELNAKARRRLWLNHFGQPESAKHVLDKERALSISSSFTDLKKIDYSAHLRAAEKLSWYQLDGESRACYELMP